MISGQGGSRYFSSLWVLIMFIVLHIDECLSRTGSSHPALNILLVQGHAALTAPFLAFSDPKFSSQGT